MSFWKLWFLQSLALSSLIFPFLRKRMLAQVNPEDLLLQTFLLLLIFQFSVGQRWCGWRCHHHQEQVNPRRASVPPSGLYASLWDGHAGAWTPGGTAQWGCLHPSPTPGCGDTRSTACLLVSPNSLPEPRSPPPPSKPRASLLTPLQCHISGHFAFPEE